MSRIARCVCASLVLVASAAHADLVPQLGGLVVYDTDRDISWLADTKAIQGSAYDDGDFPNDGLVTWASAISWVAALTVGGFTDWRLAAAPQPDPTCANPSEAFGQGCTGSELGHMFYVELSGQPNTLITTSGDPDLALFTNLDNIVYWSKDLHSSSGLNLAFDFSSGTQGGHALANQFGAWAVRDGPVEPVAVPALNAAGLAVLVVSILSTYLALRARCGPDRASARFRESP